MPVGIFEVMNNTSSVLHYVNTQTGYNFDLNPTVPTKSGKGGTIPTSPFYADHDLVPSKSSGHYIHVSVDNGHGPTFTVTDDGSSWVFSVDCDAKDLEWRRPLRGGLKCVMRVDPHGMSIVGFEEGLRSGQCGFVVKGPNLDITEDYASAYYAMTLR